MKTSSLLSLCLSLGIAFGDEVDFSDHKLPAHDYWKRDLHDPFTQIKSKLESGEMDLDHGSEKNFVASLLEELEIPKTSQMLVFSATSLQSGRISTRNPRALYFNEDLYLGWVPGGKIEIVSIDPALGGIFYIFDIPKPKQRINVERSRNCMTCHSVEETGYVPGIVIESVMPGPNMGSLEGYRLDDIGHEVPLSERFGGWHLTGNHGMPTHKANQVGKLWKGELSTRVVAPGELSDLNRYPVPTSDILPQLIHEHQAGFVNCVVEATYRARTYLYLAPDGELSPDHAAKLDKQAERLTRYILFADEAQLPKNGLQGDKAYAMDFQKRAKKTVEGASLRDLDLKTRLFKHRCSYMIYTPLFSKMPPIIKDRVFRDLKAALDPKGPKAFAHLPAEEKKTILGILKETLPDFK